MSKLNLKLCNFLQLQSGSFEFIPAGVVSNLYPQLGPLNHRKINYSYQDVLKSTLKQLYSEITGIEQSL